MKWMFGFALIPFMTFGGAIPTDVEVNACFEAVIDVADHALKQKDVQPISEMDQIQKQLNNFSVNPPPEGDMKRCYSKNKKPATMEDEAMRRAKVFHRGLPIEGCAPLGPEEHKKRFDEAKRKLEEAKKQQSSKSK